MLENNPACSYCIYLKDREEKDTPEHPDSDCGVPGSEQGSRTNTEPCSRAGCNVNAHPLPACERWGWLTFAECQRSQPFWLSK